MPLNISLNTARLQGVTLSLYITSSEIFIEKRGIFTFSGAFLFFFICGPIVLKIGQCTWI